MNPNLRISERRAARARPHMISTPFGHQVVHYDPPFADGYRTLTTREHYAARSGFESGKARTFFRPSVPKLQLAPWVARTLAPASPPLGRWVVFNADGYQVWGPGSRVEALEAAKWLYETQKVWHELGTSPAPRPYHVGELPE